MYEYNDAQAKYLDEKETYLDKFIDESDDEALFLSRYIHGHCMCFNATFNTDRWI